MAKNFTFIDGVSIRGMASAPADLANGDIYYNTTTNTFRAMANGTESDIGSNTGATVTGSEEEYWGASPAPTGYVLASGNTIGSASSGATERANADTQNLFTLLWNSTDNTTFPIQTSGGAGTTRGASAAADFAANKRFPLPDKRGRTSAGKDDLGGTAANRITSGGSGITGTTLGAAGGTETNTLSSPQMPSHTHPISDPTHHNPWVSYYDANPSPAIPNSSQNLFSLSGAPVSLNRSTNPATTGITSTNSAGSSGAHQNTQPGIVCNIVIKL